MREVRAEHQAIEGQMVAHLDRLRIADDPEPEVVEDVLRRLALELAIEGALEDLVVVVDHEEAPGQPARVDLGEVELEIREAIEDAGADQLAHVYIGGWPETRWTIVPAKGSPPIADADARHVGRELAETEMRRQLHPDLEGLRFQNASSSGFVRSRSRSGTCAARPSGSRCRRGTRSRRSRRRRRSSGRRRSRSADPARPRSSPSRGTCCRRGSARGRRPCRRCSRSRATRRSAERGLRRRSRRCPARAGAAPRRPRPSAGDCRPR